MGMGRPLCPATSADEEGGDKDTGATEGHGGGRSGGNQKSVFKSSSGEPLPVRQSGGPTLHLGGLDVVCVTPSGTWEAQGRSLRIVFLQ